MATPDTDKDTDTETETETTPATGRIEEIQGVVVEVTFPNGELPEIFNAITVARGGGGDDDALDLLDPACGGRALGLGLCVFVCVFVCVWRSHWFLLT